MTLVPAKPGRRGKMAVNKTEWDVCNLCSIVQLNTPPLSANSDTRATAETVDGTVEPVVNRAASG